MACFCIGPQNGEPVCPCRMRFVQVRDGRYVEVNDLGPVVTVPPVKVADFWAEDRRHSGRSVDGTSSMTGQVAPNAGAFNREQNVIRVPARQ